MKMPCDKHVNCDCLTLLTNYSSEDPDMLLFLGRGYHNPQYPPRLGPNTPITECGESFSSSWMSQTQADDCADRQQLVCENGNVHVEDPCEVCQNLSTDRGTIWMSAPRVDVIAETRNGPQDQTNETIGPCCDISEVQAAIDSVGQDQAILDAQGTVAECCCESGTTNTDPNVPGGPSDPPDPPPPILYPNQEQCSTVACSDGQESTYCVPANTFLASSPGQANAMAQSRANRTVRERLLCLEAISEKACLAQIYDQVLQASMGPQVIGPISFSVEGDVPPGVNYSTNEPLEHALSFYGQMTMPGHFHIKVKATATSGQTRTREFTIGVLGLTTGVMDLNGVMIMPSATVDESYSQQLSADGGTAPYTFDYDHFNAPSWLTISSGGLMSSVTPPTAVASGVQFAVYITDSSGQSCTQLVSVGVHGPKFLNSPPNGTRCVAYSFQMLTDPVGCTFSGTCPGGLSISASGLITGTPSSLGTWTPNQFNIVAVDPQGNQHQKIFLITIVTDGGIYPKAIADMVWDDTGSGGGNGGTGGGSAQGGSGSLFMTGAPSAFNSAGIARLNSRISRCLLAGYDVRIQASWGLITGSGTQDEIKCIFQNVTIYNDAVAKPLGGGSFDVTLPAAGWLQTQTTDPGVYFQAQGSTIPALAGFTWQLSFTITPLYPP